MAISSLTDVNNWDHYQTQLNEYLLSIRSNPYVNELKEDFKKESVKMITKFLSSSYKDWLLDCIEKNHITYEWISSINKKFHNEVSMKSFCKYIESNINICEVVKLQKITSYALEDIYKSLNNITHKKFNPTKLKFVTTTGVAYLNKSIDFKEVYSKYKADDSPIDISEGLCKVRNSAKIKGIMITPEQEIEEAKTLSNYSNVVYKNDSIMKVVGCKTGNLAIKGYFKKKVVGDFYNCATLQVILDKNKCANVKMFNNGKLQLTGITHPDLGPKAVSIICKLINDIYNITDVNKAVSLETYHTVMINTCYDLRISIDRDITSSILSKQYGFVTVWEGDGYPGVRILYYYNTMTVDTPASGKCICKGKKCDGKGTGDGENQCRKISIALFQSGKVIIAGGCSQTEPIYTVYDHFNKIISEISHKIIKISTRSATKNSIGVDKSKITNIELYNKMLTM